ncbi:SDR family NAD(P)-dependent oxidoreductase [Billgrantia diversa]|uniref:SDR family NAD(P)-dependent oxidoreductase n=1 Tax=Halomonas sp. MCCC 1A13316 TaxID=2733487 RepID=UPI0018A540DB|nr:SDR family NAD(P)-dependent oxidoreductase [Halomonas sp. MCCC 1A13316]QOR37454.1 SDR family NAD(P)-dependent oxidoreductase [Halomonas sp. MCCC 1A13316]
MSAANRLILITGASGAIGGALARAYAARDTQLLLQGRDRQALMATVSDCEAQGAKVTPVYAELTDSCALDAWLDELVGDRLPDLAILAAGMNTDIGTRGEGESQEKSTRLLALNLQAPMQMATVLAPRMLARGSGQLVFLSSLAAWFGLPVTPSYCASKAGIKAYGEALRGWLSPHGIGVTVVMPGYVSSAMAAAMPGPKPFEWPPQRAARAIRRGIERNRARVSFPFPLSLGSWSLSLLPAGLSQRLVRWLGYGAPR